MLVGLLSGQIWSLLTGLGAIAAGWYALSRRPAADFVVALAGACLALFAGVANAAVFTRSIAPVPWSPEIARVMVAVALITGAGATLAGILRLHATARVAGAQTQARTRTP
ncbi:hypothetical protein NKG94_27450 [Micromonospora sp. M12]